LAMLAAIRHAPAQQLRRRASSFEIRRRRAPVRPSDRRRRAARSLCTWQTDVAVHRT